MKPRGNIPIDRHFDGVVPLPKWTDASVRSPLGVEMTAVASPAGRDIRQGEILRAAVEVFATEGYQGTDVQDVANKAGVGKGTVYRHFGDKEHLFRAVGAYCRERLSGHVARSLPAGDGGDIFAANGAGSVLRLIARECARFYQENPEALEILILERAHFRRLSTSLQATLRAEMRQGLDVLFENARGRGLLRDLPTTDMADAFADSLIGSLYNGSSYGEPDQLVRRVEQSMEILLHGLVKQ